MVDRAAAMLDADELKAIFRELGKTYGEQSSSSRIDAADAWRKLLEVGRRLRGDGRPRGDLPRRGAVDRRHRRQDAARRGLRGPDREDRRVPRGRRRSGTRQVSEPDKATPRVRRRSSSSTRRTTRRSSTLEKLHTAASRWEPLIELYLARLETRERRRDRTSSCADRARLRGEARRQEPGLRRARQRLQRGLRRPRRRSGTSSGWRRPPAAGASSSRPPTTGCRTQTEPHAEDPPLPAPRQVVRRGPRPPRVRAAVLRSRSSRSTRTTSACCARWRSLYQKNGNWQQLRRDAHAARSTSRSPTSIARRSCTELGELLEQPDEPDRPGDHYYKRALDVDRPTIPALEALERIYAAARR